MAERDPFEMLGELRPPDADAPLAVGEDPVAEAMLVSILLGETAGAEPTDAPVRRRRRRRALVAAIAAFVLGTAAVAAAIWWAQPADPTAVSCYSEASADPQAQVEMGADPDRPPAEQCRRWWVEGPLGTGEVPPLTACVTADGITAVVPGGDTVCESIGMARRAPGLDDGQADDVAIVAAVSERFAGQCHDTATAEAILDDILAEFPDAAWRVEVTVPTNETLACAVVSPMLDDRRFLVAAVPPEPLD